MIQLLHYGLFYIPNTAELVGDTSIMADESDRGALPLIPTPRCASKSVENNRKQVIDTSAERNLGMVSYSASNGAVALRLLKNLS